MLLKLTLGQAVNLRFHAFDLGLQAQNVLSGVYEHLHHARTELYGHVLLQISKGYVPGYVNFALIRTLQTHDDAYESGLAGTVWAYYGTPGALFHVKGSSGQDRNLII